MELNRYIDSTILKPDATESDIVALCEEAKAHRFKSVCINPCWVKKAHDLLEGTDTGVCTVIGFPLGANGSDVKAYEAEQAVQDGADELDMVINIGALKSGLTDWVLKDIQAVRNACQGKVLKVIIECCLLTDAEKVTACQLARKAGADFVKTSTGFSKSGATVADVALMRKTVGPDMGVKAAGGIRDKAFMEALIKAGATRIGTSHGKDLIK